MSGLISHGGMMRRQGAPGGGGGGTSPGTGSLVAWYDFDNTIPGEGTKDSHGTYDLSISGSPTYQTAAPPKYGIAAETPSACWTQSLLDNNWSAIVSDKAYAIRWRGYGGLGTGSTMFEMGIDRFSLGISSGNITTEIGNISINTGITYVLGTWYTMVVSLNNTTGAVNVWVNGALSTGSGTVAHGTGGADIGGRNGSGEDVELDYAFFYLKQLTGDNADWIYNTGGSRAYGEL